MCTLSLSLLFKTTPREKSPPPCLLTLFSFSYPRRISSSEASFSSNLWIGESVELTTHAFRRSGPGAMGRPTNAKKSAKCEWNNDFETSDLTSSRVIDISAVVQKCCYDVRRDAHNGSNNPNTGNVYHNPFGSPLGRIPERTGYHQIPVDWYCTQVDNGRCAQSQVGGCVHWTHEAENRKGCVFWNTWITRLVHLFSLAKILVPFTIGP